MENKLKEAATTSRKDTTKHQTEKAPRQSHGTHTGEGAIKLEGPWQPPHEQNTIERTHGIKGQKTAADNTDTVTDIRIVYVFVLSYTSYFHIVEVKYG